ncbi:methyltransferase-like protein 2 isoform X2 [Ipomoea triloba]|uniref:methyltransferase-like protein 2 isoform X2 n=1 Tax=Ipomoea triloba TaxID=35885 RepID=UPI00125D727D|nr:methyltransferase-like protein 2 isoform X2 [Ipomoea triloba]XP_031118868.1 methyltransferase-like protein 2 isoform X2 [Ipomoea triloba]
MEDDQLSSFLKSGVYRLQSANAFFIDPVRVVNRSYTRYRVSPSAYYSRFFESTEKLETSAESRKRKRKEKKTISLNEREKVAEQRHQEVRPLLLKAHGALLGATELLKVVRNLRCEECTDEERRELSQQSCELSFVDLGSVWQAPLYEIVLNYQEGDAHIENEGSRLGEDLKQDVIPAFDNLIVNKGSGDAEAEFLNHKYIIPKESCFYMSDVRKIHNLIPADSDSGFNIIVIDPPWENSSAHQKQRYQTLPNRFFLSLPIKQLTHTAGALVALWVTNKEKLRSFVEKELFPAWGVKYVTSFYWLKVKANGSLISELDLFHHRPYECLLLGYSDGKDNTSDFSKLNAIPNNQVFMSVPGDYSRKPPIGENYQLDGLLGEMNLFIFKLQNILCQRIDK